MDQRLTFKKHLTWEEVFHMWEQIEGSMPHWVEHYHKRGFSSWRDWRTSSTAPIKPETLAWALYDIAEPLNIIPTFHGGPFHSWIKNIYQGKDTPLFSDIIQNEIIRTRIEASGFLERFPAATTLTGLLVGDDIVIIEGMHRCCTVALAAEQGRTIKSKISIALATFLYARVPNLGHPDSPT